MHVASTREERAETAPDPEPPIAPIAPVPSKCDNMGRTVARIGELESKQREAQAERAASEAWARTHCFWDNSPERSLFLVRSGERYEVVERFSGFSASRPYCKPGGTDEQLAAAGRIAQTLVEPRTYHPLLSAAETVELDRLRILHSECRKR